VERAEAKPMADWRMCDLGLTCTNEFCTLFRAYVPENETRRQEQWFSEGMELLKSDLSALSDSIGHGLRNGLLVT
jgi:hypothetical protein